MSPRLAALSPIVRSSAISVAATLSVGAIAVAATSSGGGSAGVKVCEAKSTGVLSIPKNDKCSSSQRSVTLGEQGETGATGPQGAAGASGTAGGSGTAGAPGAGGATGPTGATGVQGIPGTASAKGATGAVGATGIAGATGVKGATGSTGVQGLQGIQGIQGNQGIQGIQGAAGPSAVGFAVPTPVDTALNDNGYTVVAQRVVGPGTYLVSGLATIEIGSYAGSVVQSSCRLYDGSGFMGQSQDRRTVDDATVYVRQTIMGAAVHSSGVGTITLTCRSGGNINAEATDIQLILQQVGGIF